MTAQSLPALFADLELFIDWSLTRERERTEKREASTMDDVSAFYDAVFPRMEEIVKHLDAFPFDALPEKEHRLYLLTLSLVEVSNLVERYKRREAIIAVSALDYSSVQ